ncbi:trace amine-associated receptor 13c-like [Cyclopterus lumpus]|uniref:G-protein coupled receptors family 1 profile domain-containing protein n=1 Tax=Cyclopterus lumpus TaxID=8103 RepID=A0A8C2XAM9_CYCLU|nr:trace amine-associated receptor 13c-like [Cyclopterus lumpus]
METTEDAELCFPLLHNRSCRKPPSDGMLVNVLLYFISLLTAALNLLVIISISHFRQLHSPTNLLILSLAVSDFLVGLLLMPVDILFGETCWYLGDFMCALFNVIDYIIISSSVGTMVLISIDRYLAICDPLHYNIRVTLDRTKISICLCWIFSVVYGIVMLMDSLIHYDSDRICYGECFIVHTYITGVVDLVLTVIAPITIIIVLYMRIFVVAVSQAQAMRTHIVSVTQQRPVGLTAKKSELKAARTLGVVVVVFLICLCPLYFSAFSAMNLSSTFVTWLFFCNSSLNPLIYALFYPWFKKSMKLILTFKILQPDSCDMTIL